MSLRYTARSVCDTDTPWEGVSPCSEDVSLHFIISRLFKYVGNLALAGSPYLKKDVLDKSCSHIARYPLLYDPGA